MSAFSHHDEAFLQSIGVMSVEPATMKSHCARCEQRWQQIVESWIRQAQILDHDRRSLCRFSGILMVIMVALLFLLYLAGSGAGWW